MAENLVLGTNNKPIMRNGEPVYFGEFIDTVKIKGFDGDYFYKDGGITINVKSLDGKKVKLRTTGKMKLKEILENIEKGLR